MQSLKFHRFLQTTSDFLQKAPKCRCAKSQNEKCKANSYHKTNRMDHHFSSLIVEPFHPPPISPVPPDRYPIYSGISGRTQGEKKLNTPCKNTVNTGMLMSSENSHKTTSFLIFFLHFLTEIRFLFCLCKIFLWISVQIVTFFITLFNCNFIKYIFCCQEAFFPNRTFCFPIFHTNFQSSVSSSL